MEMVEIRDSQEDPSFLPTPAKEISNDKREAIG